jgi:hypothetical protein
MMPRPVKWSRDLHPIRERARSAKTETWSRQDIEQLFGISRPSAQNLMKAIGEIQSVGAAHFIDRTSLLGFLDEMIASPSVEDALRLRAQAAPPVTRPRPLSQSLPDDLRRIVLADIPPNISLSQGEVRVTGRDAEEIVNALFILAQVLQNDLSSVRHVLDPPPETRTDVEDELKALFQELRRRE